jgi:glycosyltransferase involved in cell wall biosynthesis
MRIAFVDQTGAAAGGAQESFALLLQHLPAHIEPHVVLFHEGEYAGRLRSYGFDVNIIPLASALDELRREHIGASGAASAPAAVFSLARWLKARGIAVVYTHTVKAHFVGAPAARLAGIPCVMHLRDILEGTAKHALRVVSAACSRERIAISKGVADAYGLPRTTVVFNPVEIERFAQLPSREEACARLGIPFESGLATVGIVGRINRWKGHDRFLRIASEVSASGSARFIIAGSPIFRDEDFLPELRRQAHEAGIGGRVHFIPWVDDVQNLYAALDVHCNCSLREPFGRSIIEAAAAGVPTICFSDAGAAEVLTNGVDGCVVPAGDEAAFARALIGALESSERLASMKIAARELAVRFEPVRHASQVTRILERAAA